MKTLLDRIQEKAVIEIEREVRRKQREICAKCAEAAGVELRRLCMSQQTIEQVLGKIYEQQPDLI